MKKVKEELMLSLIFVGKWLILGLGVVGVLYLAISLAYNKSYYEPRMDKFDLDIAEITESMSALMEKKATLEVNLDLTVNKIKLLEDDKLAKVEKEIEDAKLVISELDLKWWQKLPAPMFKGDQSTKQAYKDLDELELQKKGIVNELNKLRDIRKSSNQSIVSAANKIKKNEMDILEKKRDKKRAEVDVKGPILWLIGILGLT